MSAPGDSDRIVKVAHTVPLEQGGEFTTTETLHSPPRPEFFLQREPGSGWFQTIDCISGKVVDCSDPSLIGTDSGQRAWFGHAAHFPHVWTASNADVSFNRFTSEPGEAWFADEVVIGSERPVDPMLVLAESVNALRVTIEARGAKPNASTEHPTCYRPTIALCVELVAMKFGIDQRDILGEVRAAPIVRARRVAMWLACEVTGRSLPVIGRFFNRDHTTIMEGRNAMKALRATEPAFRDRTDALLALFRPEAV